MRDRSLMGVWLIILAFLSGCATTDDGANVYRVPQATEQSVREWPIPESIDAAFTLEFHRFFVTTLDSRPVKWLTVKVDNTGNIPLGKPVVRVVDMTNEVDVYGGRSGLGGGGFHEDDSTYGPSDKKYLIPGEHGFVAVNVGRPEGPLLTVFVTLVNEQTGSVVERVLEVNMAE